MFIQIRRMGYASLILAAGVTLYGCGENRPAATASISGTVTYDGAPLGIGTIAFSPADGTGPASEAQVQDGKYEVKQLTAGKKKVLIQGFKARGAGTGEPMFRESAPGAVQEVDVAAGPQTRDFAVSPKK